VVARIAAQERAVQHRVRRINSRGDAVELNARFGCVRQSFIGYRTVRLHGMDLRRVDVTPLIWGCRAVRGTVRGGPGRAGDLKRAIATAAPGAGRIQQPACTRAPALRRAAGQLRHVLGEGLRTELQPLDHGQVREQLARELGDRHAVMNGECRRLNELAGLGRHRLHAK